MELKTELPPVQLMDRILSDVDYQAYIDDGTEEGHDRWENVEELRRVAAEYREPGLNEFLETIALVSDQDTLESSGNVPTLLTLHAAKGLEFPVVFIAGLNDGTLPHSRSFDDAEAMMEERRLLYVGITRAEDRLYLLYAKNRLAYGVAESSEPSRFLDDIPIKLLDITKPVRPERRSAGYVAPRADRWEISSSAKTPVQLRYQPGMRVRHPSWGEGMVLNSRLQDDDEVVDVFFEEMGLKRLMASIASLETIK
jgi:DNA helicase-2/ATP-dependent DNA helicase PcrA